METFQNHLLLRLKELLETSPFLIFLERHLTMETVYHASNLFITCSKTIQGNLPMQSYKQCFTLQHEVSNLRMKEILLRVLKKGNKLAMLTFPV